MRASYPIEQADRRNARPADAGDTDHRAHGDAAPSRPVCDEGSGGRHAALLTTLLDRARAKGAERLASFDAGYLAETFEQVEPFSPDRGACPASTAMRWWQEPRARFPTRRSSSRLAMITADGHRGESGGARARRQIQRQHRPPPRPQYRQPRAISLCVIRPKGLELSGLIQSSAAPCMPSSAPTISARHRLHDRNDSAWNTSPLSYTRACFPRQRVQDSRHTAIASSLDP